MSHTVELLSIEEVVRKKSYKNSIDRMNVDIKSLIDTSAPRYTNLLAIPNSQRLISYSEMPTTDLSNQKKQLLDTRIRKQISQKSRERIANTDTRPTPEHSFREGQSASKERRSLPKEEPQGRQLPLIKEQKMNKTLNAFLFKMQLPDNLRAMTSQQKKRIRYIKESESNSIDLRMDTSPSKQGCSLKPEDQMIRPSMSTQQPLIPSVAIPPRPGRKHKRQQKIPEFIKINLLIEQVKEKDIPRASALFAERKVKSVIKFRKKKDIVKPQTRQNTQQSRKFATIQPQVMQLKIMKKCNHRKSQNTPREAKSREEPQRRRRRMPAEKLFQGDICGWNNNENDDHLNYF